MAKPTPVLLPTLLIIPRDYFLEERYILDGQIELEVFLAK